MDGADAPKRPDQDTPLSPRPIEDGLKQIFRIADPTKDEASSSEPIKLLEVNENTVPAAVVPLRFGPYPDLGLTYPTVIVEVTPEKFEQTSQQDIAAPAPAANRRPRPFTIGSYIFRTEPASRRVRASIYRTPSRFDRPNPNRDRAIVMSGPIVRKHGFPNSQG